MLYSPFREATPSKTAGDPEGSRALLGKAKAAGLDESRLDALERPAYRRLVRDLGGG